MYLELSVSYVDYFGTLKQTCGFGCLSFVLFSFPNCVLSCSVSWILTCLSIWRVKFSLHLLVNQVCNYATRTEVTHDIFKIM